MKKTTFILTIVAFLLGQFTVTGQDREDNSDRWERYRSEKVAFLTNKLDLTPNEAEKFWPIYNEMDKQRSEVQQERRKLEREVQAATENLSDKQIIKLTRDYTGNMEKECHLSTTYNEEFLKILPPQKVLRLYKAENEFRMYMFRRFREHQQQNEENEN